MLSQRARHLSLSRGHSTWTVGGSWCQLNPYALDNPNGTISLGSAENRLCSTIVSRKLNDCMKKEYSSGVQFYTNFVGEAKLRTLVAEYLSRFFDTYWKVDMDDIIILNGADTLLEQFAFCVADANECILVPAPYYGAILENFESRACVKPCSVNFLPKMSGDSMLSTISCDISPKMLEDAYEKASAEGFTVKGLCLVNPNNPTGCIMSIKSIMDCLWFAKKHCLHVCVDEVYGLSCYAENAEFRSVLSIPDLPDPPRTHVIYGFSKDLSLSGFRIGIFYTQNQELKEALGAASYFHSVPTFVQRLLTRYLDDEQWLDDVYFPQNIAALRSASAHLQDSLRKLEIPFVVPQGGFFVWAYFGKFLHPRTITSELKLWYLFLHEGLYINPGQACMCDDPGWFRLIFSQLEGPTVDVAVQRIAVVIEKLKANPDVLDGVDLDAEKDKTAGMIGFY